MDLPEAKIKRKVKSICYKLQAYISYPYSPEMRILAKAIKNELRKRDIDVWDRYDLPLLDEKAIDLQRESQSTSL